MPTATGTASTAVDLLNKLNTFLTSNGWTKLRGETDLQCNSPKAARYWRILCTETDDIASEYKQIKQLEWRTTSGGANQATVNGNYSFSSINGSHDLVGGTINATSAQIYNGIWWVQYDFGSATTIREIVMTCGTQNYAPARFYVQWSNDAFSWTTMIFYDYNNSRFTANNQPFTFTWDAGGGYLAPRHAGNNLPRRRGHSYYTTEGTDDRYREWCDDIWCWQGPGYDAARRVYVYGMPSFDLTTSDEFISWGGALDINTNLDASEWFYNQNGNIGNQINDNCPTHQMSSAGVTYWFYVNSKRFIVVTRSGVDDYSMSYVGFMSAFALPNDHPFPLLIAGSTDSISYSLSTSGTYVRDGQDPSVGSAYFRRFDNVWRSVANHDFDGSRSENWTSAADAVVWPKHIGVSGRSNYPSGVMGDHINNLGHYMKLMDPTEQGDLPVLPCIVLDRAVGYMGAMDGVYVIPQGGVLAPEATFVIGLDTYRVFRTRTFADGNQYYCIKEV